MIAAAPVTSTDRWPADAPEVRGLRPFTGWSAATPYLRDGTAKRRKVLASLREAIVVTGLTDGDTISFHHAFREGDRVILPVLAEIEALGIRDLTLAASSLNECHEGLIGFIERGVITRIYTSGMRGALARRISHGGLLRHPVQVHSHGGRAALMESGELRPAVAFLGVPACDEMGNANGISGTSRCGSLGYALVDAQFARNVVLLTEQIVPFPHTPAVIRQDRVDFVVPVQTVGNPNRINVGATRTTRNPRDLLIARLATDVLEHSGLFVDGFSVQTGSGGAATGVTNFLGERMRTAGVTARWALGGITSGLVALHEQGLVERLLDVQSFDGVAAASLEQNPRHTVISAAEYASPLAKAACVDELDMVVLSALEIDLDFNINVLTGADGMMMGASGGHCDTAAGAQLVVVVAPLIRTRIPTIVPRVTTLVTPGENIDVLVTEYGIAVNPRHPQLAARLAQAGVGTTTIEALYDRALQICGRPAPLVTSDEIVGVVRYRDGSVIDVVRAVSS
ncbi:citrate lyase subunit alpha/citrate CoA-transferase [Kineosphaera limosa]|uniref:Citrate lyase alpha chain n=1 Tax=Kineosphaera limosa NBRC 100340 TaxID=1184609 RepID=K6WV99_9MICO|nr:citrate lyase subunit alpha [Kineosphaera limosa]NYE02436.1 citrate lyase subunit alpha/citrate CoA-transferase [Kineosphaera limosa]GAB96037.1 citrate lyase alpha subunit [Kineosphaera limosa NBRC 100340]